MSRRMWKIGSSLQDFKRQRHQSATILLMLQIRASGHQAADAENLKRHLHPKSFEYIYQETNLEMNGSEGLIRTMRRGPERWRGPGSGEYVALAGDEAVHPLWDTC